MNNQVKIEKIEDGPNYRFYEPPKLRWITSIGELNFHHTVHINWWKRFWLRFMGWKVTKVEDKNDS